MGHNPNNYGVGLSERQVLFGLMSPVGAEGGGIGVTRYRSFHLRLGIK
jgi:hypothetical protein